MKIPEDFSELERRFRQSGGMGGLRLPVVRIATIAVVALVVVIGLFSSYYTVPTDSRAVVKRFGAVVGITDPGLHFKLPFGVDSVHIWPTDNVRKLEFGFSTRRVGSDRGPTSYDRGQAQVKQALMLTGDLNVIDAQWVVQYKIIDPDRWMHEVRDPEETIRAVSESVMRRVVGNRLGSDVLTVGRVDIALKVRDEMQRILESYDIGAQVLTVELQDVTPPDPVKPAFNEVNEARQEKERLVNEPEKERNQVIPRASGEAAQIISEAEAYKTERVNRAKGEAARFLSILAEYQKAESLTRERMFLEAVDAVFPRLESLFVVDEGTSGPLPLLNLDPNARRAGGGR